MLDAILQGIVRVVVVNASAANVSVSPQSLVSAGSIYTENTVTVLVQLLTILALSIQIARGYFLRILRKFTLRLAADIWWLLFIILRDASIFLVVFLGFELFWPGTYEDYPIAVPFQLLAIVFYAYALVLLLVTDTDEDPKYNKALTILVTIGTFLFIFGTIFVTESAATLSVLPPTVSTSKSNIWGFFNYYFNSINDPTMAIYSFYACFTLIVIAGLIAIYYGLKGNLPRARIITKPVPTPKESKQTAEQKQ
ncbi:MAG: hypothetical protein ARM1_0305 [Candidatus Micrarchaeota archaeon]|nr:MAG: hypothetical protein ARM1_0305 [Candidatus Micrarchaeota archaeon]